jgi:fibronectin type 3 domain-containing protein
MGKLIWRPHTDPRVAGYIIERKKLYSNEWKQVGELNHRLNVEFLDKDLETNKAYKYRVRVKTFEGLISKPSKEVEVITKARPKPILDITAFTTRTGTRPRTLSHPITTFFALRGLYLCP